ncbi:DUF3352 domain-containing protein [Gloeothece verrucosa]|uniref:DUF3352 domain-containing protein n=1 Tax=Gloeothece verrucosa (strain PCC 7822) TaxID=497965 RepID=E0UII3_GLOV7|nr:DUF3352 domain-containing protein [Gloeothece verrucosa]ADN12177.1 conserved hypothetical protein [Gloeothece verrucosa PCC 7822]
MKLRTFLSILAVGVVLLLSIAGGSLYWILSQSPLNLLAGGVTAQPAAAIVIPRQAPVMVSLLVSPERIEAFSQLIAAPANRRRSLREIREVEKSLLAKTGLNYQKEIQPWLGDEITLAVTSLDFDRNPENGIKPGYLLAVQTKDAELAKEFLQSSYSREAIAGTSDLVFEQYKGVNLIAQRPLSANKNNVTLGSSAVVADFVLFANDPKVLRDAINNVQVPGLNLKGANYYQQALKTIEDPRIGLVYGNLPALSAWIANAPVPETPEVAQMLTVAFSIKSEGLAAQTALFGVEGAAKRIPALSQPVGALNYVPANTIVTAAGTNLNQFWQTVETGLAANSPLQQLVKQLISRLEAPLGLNLPEDIFKWVKGEYSLALVPNPEGDQPDWIFVAQKVPGVETSSAITHLDDLAKQQGYSVGSLPLFDSTVTAWTKLSTATETGGGSLARLNAQVKGVHTNTDQYEIIASSVEAMSQALAAQKTSLIDSEKFQQAISALPRENDGYFYVDWNKSEPIIEQKLPIVRVIQLAGKPLFNNLRSLTLSSQGTEQGIARATVFFKLGVR